MLLRRNDMIIVDISLVFCERLFICCFLLLGEGFVGSEILLLVEG